jgi:hypothetical protein
VPWRKGRYFDVYNQPNVKLVDRNEMPIECITPVGIRTTDTGHQLGRQVTSADVWSPASANSSARAALSSSAFRRSV